MNMTCIHNFQFTTIRVTGVFIYISVLLTMPSKYSFSLGSFFVCTREANLVHNHCMDLEYIYIYIHYYQLCVFTITRRNMITHYTLLQKITHI